MKLDQRINLAVAFGICLPPIIGLVVWLVMVDNKASASQEEIRGLRPLILEVRESVIRIEEKIKHLKEK